MPYTATITDVKREFSLPDNAPYLDVWFNVLLDGEVVANRRFAFPLDTKEEVITDSVKQYCVMFERDHFLAAEADKRSESEVAANEIISKLKGQTL
jgi:hypothetical protein